jgi:hypothetical protein
VARRSHRTPARISGASMEFNGTPDTIPVRERERCAMDLLSSATSAIRNPCRHSIATCARPVPAFPTPKRRRRWEDGELGLSSCRTVPVSNHEKWFGGRAGARAAGARRNRRHVRVSRRGAQAVPDGLAGWGESAGGGGAQQAEPCRPLRPARNHAEERVRPGVRCRAK